MLDDLVAVIETLKARIEQHRADLQSNETRTRMALIDPLLTALGWDTSDPGLVTPEYDVSGKRADYALLDDKGGVFVFLEAKRLGEQLSNHQSQIVAYASELGIRYPALTNGDDWEVYDNSQLVPIDQRRILKVSITGSASATCALQLLLLWRANVGTGQVTQANQSIVQRADPPTTPPPPPLGNWIPLGDFRAVNGTKPPPVVRLPNGEERAIKYWNTLILEVAEWLVGSGHLNPQNCPIARTPSFYLVHTEAIHPNDKAFFNGKRLSNGLFVETSLSAHNSSLASRYLMQSLGQDPSSVLVRVD